MEYLKEEQYHLRMGNDTCGLGRFSRVGYKTAYDPDFLKGTSVKSIIYFESICNNCKILKGIFHFFSIVF